MREYGPILLVMNRFGLPWMVAGLLSLSFSAPPSRSFSAEEAQKIRDYWAQPGRYLEREPENVGVVGPWQPRLTPQASKWFWDYAKVKKSVDVVTGTFWENWVKARLISDRWAACSDCRQRNRDEFFVDGPPIDSDLPEATPPDPGPVPDDLAARLGEPPSLSEPAQPRTHSIRFDDVSFTYEDHIRFSSPRYSYYRFEHGVRSEGAALKTLPGEGLSRLCEAAGITESEGRVMFAVSSLEGGFDAINTYDTGYISIGFIQFACLRQGANSLGGLLADYKKADSESFDRDFRKFGIDVTDQGEMVALDIADGQETIGADAAQRIIEDKRLVAVFQRAGQMSEGFRVAQLRCAKAMYYPETVSVSVMLEDGPQMVPITDIVKSEAGLATLMDRKVNTGKIDGLEDAVSRICSRISPKKVSDLHPYEREIVTALKYRRDYLIDNSLSQPPNLNTRNVRDLPSRSGSRQKRKGAVH